MGSNPTLSAHRNGRRRHRWRPFRVPVQLRNMSVIRHFCCVLVTGRARVSAHEDKTYTFSTCYWHRRLDRCDRVQGSPGPLRRSHLRRRSCPTPSLRVEWQLPRCELQRPLPRCLPVLPFHLGRGRSAPLPGSGRRRPGRRPLMGPGPHGPCPVGDSRTWPMARVRPPRLTRNTYTTPHP